jgi:xanthine dehydrogenase accessory factor
MRDVLTALHGWWSAGKPVALATVASTYRSPPRQAGAAMLVGPGGEAAGSVSGGCGKGAVYELGTAVRDGGPPVVLQRYGVSDDDAFAVG